MQSLHRNQYHTNENLLYPPFYSTALLFEVSKYWVSQKSVSDKRYAKTSNLVIHNSCGLFTSEFSFTRQFRLNLFSRSFWKDVLMSRVTSWLASMSLLRFQCGAQEFSFFHSSRLCCQVSGFWDRILCCGNLHILSSLHLPFPRRKNRICCF